MLQVVQLSLAFTTVYQLGLEEVGSVVEIWDLVTSSIIQGIINGAVNDARALDIRQGLVNVDKFMERISQLKLLD